MLEIYNLTEEDLINYFISINEKPFRARQIISWIYRQKVKDFALMTDIKKEVRDKLNNDLRFSDLSLVTKNVSNDGTIKFLFKLNDDNLIETVLMNQEYGYSVCVTSQVGCNMGCAFCASGLKKKKRDLETFEIVLQILKVEELANIKVSHVVVMGIGEPFDNYLNVTNFLKIINHPLGLEIGQRHLTVSTCGLVPKIYEFADFPLQVNLAISLHAPNDELRSSLMPINKKYPLNELFKALNYYYSKTNRRITIEYILINDVNDTIKEALELANLLKGLNAYVNLIPYNEVLENPFNRSKKEHQRLFYDTLKKKGINVTLRKEQGSDISAACGQLRSKFLDNGR